jgi:hypothetical protein
VVAGAALAIFAPPAQAGTCPPLDPACTVSDVAEKARDVVGDIGKEAENTVERVGEAAGNTVQQVQDTGNQVLNPGGSSPGDLPTAPDPSGPNVTGPGDEPAIGTAGPPATRRTGRRPSRERASAGSRSDTPARVARPLADPISVSSASSSSSAVPARYVPDRDDGLAGAAVEAAEKFIFPLGLALAVGAFLLVQSRIDHRDPKLALAPIDGDYLSFE